MSSLSLDIFYLKELEVNKKINHIFKQTSVVMFATQLGILCIPQKNKIHEVKIFTGFFLVFKRKKDTYNWSDMTYLVFF